VLILQCSYIDIKLTYGDVIVCINVICLFIGTYNK